MRIVIFNGSQNTTTFVKALTAGLANHIDFVALAGKCNKLHSYNQDGFIRIPTGSNNPFILLLQAITNLLSCKIGKLRLAYRIIPKNLPLHDKLRKFVLYTSLLKVEPDIVHIQWATSISDFKDILQDKHNNWFKLIVSFRGFLINIKPFVDNKVKTELSLLLPLADGYHAVSEDILKNAELLGISPSKAKIVYPAIKSELLNLQLNRKHDATLQILSVGRDHWKKGYRVAIDAMALLKKRGVKFHYTIVAGGEKTELIHQIDQLKLSDHITLLDNLPHEKVIEQHAYADVFLLPSFEEGVANVVLEAMALGTPVVTTDCGGMKEVIEDGINGFIVPIRDCESIVEALVNFTKLEREERDDLIRKAKETIVRQHLLDDQISQMIGLYNQVLHA